MGIEINQELHKNFIDFSYEANSQRAFPSALDGLKPGQRACLWEFYSKGYSSNKPHVKSAKVSGGVIADYWPHGDTAIYETFARMSQPWINNIPEVDWHGGNGSIIGGPECAHQRYTEARLSKASEVGFFSNIKKDTVDMILNFSEDKEWPSVFPAIFPRLFVNGSQGIGVTIANDWVPNNLGEFVEKIKQFLSTGDITYDNIYPDFPTGGIIINKNEIAEIYKTGKGRVVLRGKTSIDKNNILIHSLPYQVYVEPFIDSIVELIKKGELTGIEDIRNKCDKKNFLIEIECNENPSIILNKLISATNLQKIYNPNQWALVSKVPQLLNLKDYIQLYTNHNLECIRKEYQYDLNKAKDKLEITEGLIKAIENIDNIIKIIKQSENVEKAKENLIQRYDFTVNQAKAIVEMKLGKLAHLEGIELLQEKEKLEKIICNCITFLNSVDKQNEEFLKRLEDFNKEFGYKRKTEVIQLSTSKEEKEIEFVAPEECVVIMSESGLIKRVPTSSFKIQKRNGKGIKTQDDIPAATIKTNTIDNLMIFTNQGKVYRLLVNDIPVGTNSTKGQPVNSLISMEPNEKPTTIYSIYRDTDAQFVLFTTKNGLVKKTSLEEYLKTKKKTGIAAITIKENDKLASVTLIKDENLLLITKNGIVIRFNSNEITPTSRTTSGVKGISLDKNDEIVTILPIRNLNDNLALFTKNGLGKKIKLSEFPLQKRGGKGLLSYKIDDTVGEITGAILISDKDNILTIGNTNSICISAIDIPLASRNSIGNQIIKDNNILSVSKI